MSNLLQKINETLTQLNEVEDLRNTNKDNKLKSLIDLLKNPQTNIKQTEVKVENSFNNNLNKQKSTKVSAKAKFSWFGKKK